MVQILKTFCTAELIAQFTRALKKIFVLDFTKDGMEIFVKIDDAKLIYLGKKRNTANTA